MLIKDFWKLFKQVISLKEILIISNIYHLEIKMGSKLDLWIIIVKQHTKEMGVSWMSFNQEPCTEWVPFANVIRIKDCFMKYKEAYPDKPSKSLTNLANTAQCTWLHVEVQFVFPGFFPFTAAPLAKALPTLQMAYCNAEEL